MKTEAEHLGRENTTKVAVRDQIIAFDREVIFRKNISGIVFLLALLSLAFVMLLWCFYTQKRDSNVVLEKKIIERTRELKASREELLKAFREHELLLQRTSYGVNETLKSTTGLCFTGMKEIPDPLALSYIKRIDSTSRRLGMLVR